MLTRESFTDDPDNVAYLIRWWVSLSQYRHHRVLKRGTMRDFIHDVWLRILDTFPPGKSSEFALSTIICSTCRWELSESVRVCRKRTERDFMHNMWAARRVRPSDRVEDGEQQIIEYLQMKHMNLAIAKVMRTLTFREAIVIRARYGLFGDEPLNLDDVAKPLKVTRERVRQIEAKAIKKIQHYSRAKNLIPYLEDMLNGEDD